MIDWLKVNFLMSTQLSRNENISNKMKKIYGLHQVFTEIKDSPAQGVSKALREIKATPAWQVTGL